MSVPLFVGLLSLISGFLLVACVQTDLSRPVVLAFVLGISIPLLVKHAAWLLLSTGLDPRHERPDKQGRLYGLEHGILNVDLPPRSMWMNLGFWRDAPATFAEACSALLDEVLLTAGVAEKGVDGKLSLQRPMAIIDVGFGCGDQSLHLMSMASASTGEDDTGSSIGKAPSQAAESSVKLLRSYVGITMDSEQFTHARSRFIDAGLLPAGETRSGSTKFSIFQADAADPQSWQPELKQAIERQAVFYAQHKCETWLLGLDSLYHFSPSRKPVLVHAQQQLQASVMAFDLALSDSDSKSLLDTLFLRLFCVMTSTPYGNLMTATEYRQQLKSVGYTDVSMKDVSEDVFAPLVKYLNSQDAALQVLGKSLGAFRVASWVFAWWARTGLIRAYIVVAWHPQVSSSHESH